MAEDPYESFKKNIPSQPPSSESSNIHAVFLDEKIIENLKLLKSLIRGEKVRFNQFIKDELVTEKQKKSAIESLQKKIIKEFSFWNLSKLAQLIIPKKVEEECFNILVHAWRQKIFHEYSQTLTLLKLSFSKESFRALVIALSLSVNLKALRIEHCYLDFKQAKIFAVFIKVHPTIHVLHMSDNPFQDKGFLSIATSLMQNNTIKHLHLDKIQVTDKSLPYIEEMLKAKKYLTFSLKGNLFSEECVLNLKQIALDVGCELTLE